MNKIRIAAAWVLLGLAVACDTTGRGSIDTARNAEDRAAIDRGHEAFLDAMRANNTDSLRPLIAEDAVFTPPNVSIEPGREAFLTWYQQVLTQVKTSAVTVSDRDVTIVGDWAIETGKFDWTVTPVAGGAPVRDQGNFLAVWRREPDRTWKVTRDIWNSTKPLPVNAPARRAAGR